MIARHNAERRLLDYLSAKSGAANIDLDLDLIDNRVVDSLGFMNFMLLIEELSEKPIEMDQLNQNDFRTLRTIGERFLSHLPEGSERQTPDGGDSHV